MTNEQNSALRDLHKQMVEAHRLKRDDPEAFEAQRLAKLPWTRCAMCSTDFKGYGNNAQPILEVGKVCCDGCNTKIVLVQRIRDDVRERATKLGSD